MEKKNLRTVYGLLFKSGSAVRWVNLITLYRIVTAPILVVLILTGQLHIFKWMLLVSFSTDMVDGFLARKYKAISILGAKLDSIGDDLTVFVALFALYKINPTFFSSELTLVVLLLSLFIIQLLVSFIRYRKPSNFHTYLAKTAALLQGCFLLSFFLFEEIYYWLFYAACLVTTLELIEEIVIACILPKWECNVKGIYWVVKDKKK